MNSLVNGLKAESNWTRTENGMLALQSTTSSLVDLFGTIGALRTRSEAEIESLFSKAFAEDKLLATKMAFYSRDIRLGGLGERRTPQVIWKFLANNYPDIMAKNIHLVPLFGKWDDLYIFVGTPVEEMIWQLITKQIREDLVNMKDGKPISLLAKWLKSENSKNSKTRKLGMITANRLKLTPRAYRKMLSRMRKYLKVVEVDMSAKNWSEINYQSVPSLAMNHYRNAFRRRDEERFAGYIQSVTKGEAKINANTLFPYDIIEKYLFGYGNNDAVLEAQWKALPNYISGEDNILIMADVSGSMSGRPMATSIGLAIYFAERNNGCFKDLFMTFSRNPTLQEVKGNSLREKVMNLRNAHWQMNTNIDAAFDMVLKTAVKNNCLPEDMPKAIVIISDMEFDANNGGHGALCQMSSDFYTHMKKAFAAHGYVIPNIVFWNVNSRNDTFHANCEYAGVQLASGQSASTFKSVITGIGMTPYEAMLEVINSEVYACVTV